MALEPQTVSTALAQIKGRFQRQSNTVDSYMQANVESMLDELCRLYPWWFLTTNPGTLLRATFPISNLGAVPFKGGNWADIGWLITSPGVQVYDIWAPANESAYYTTPSDTSQWRRAYCQEVRFVYEFDKDGNFVQDLDVQDDTSALTFMGLSTRTRPTQVMARTLEDRTQLVFDPIPDTNYLYAVSFTQGYTPIYTRDGGGSFRHKLLDVIPEAFVQYGIMKAAQMFDEPALAAQAEKALMGTPPNIHLPRGKKASLGILDTLRNDTVKKQQQWELEKMAIFRSKASASGRGGAADSLTMHQKYFSPYWRRSIY